jgi:hypothetical protein
MTVCHTSVRFFFLWWVLGLCACKAGAHKALYCLSHTSSSHLLDFASQKFYSWSGKNTEFLSMLGKGSEDDEAKLFSSEYILA